jgi:hypothetical protein
MGHKYGGCSVSARTLLALAYVILALDTAVFLEFIAGAIYLAQTCPIQLEIYTLFLYSHFSQLMTIWGVISQWETDLSEPPHRVKDTRPINWMIVSIVCITGDSILLASAVLNPEPQATCRYNQLHRVLDGQGIAICGISILWWTASAILTRKTNKAKAEKVKEAVEDPHNVYNSALTTTEIQ